MIEEINDVIVAHWRAFRDLQERDEPIEEAVDVINRMLNLKPWEISPADADSDGPSPWPSGTAGHENWPRAQALRRRLDALAGTE